MVRIRAHFLLEAQLIHLADYPQTGLLVQCQPGLQQQPVGPRPARLAGGIEPHTGLAHPDQQGTGPRRQGYGSVADPGAGFQHQADQTEWPAQHQPEGQAPADPPLPAAA
jgi:hypothetical protein